VFAVSTLELTLRMLVALAVVGVLMYGTMRLARTKVGVSGTANPISIRARQQLTRSTAAMVLEVGARQVLIAVNDDSVTVLAEGDDLVPVDRDGASTTRPSKHATNQQPQEQAQEIVDLGAKEPRSAADGVGNEAGKHRGGEAFSSASGKKMIDALRERTVRRG